jgi:hypothetical protein
MSSRVLSISGDLCAFLAIAPTLGTIFYAALPRAFQTGEVISEQRKEQIMVRAGVPLSFSCYHAANERVRVSPTIQKNQEGKPHSRDCLDRKGPDRFVAPIPRAKLDR